jgi:putative ABC transport system permease protein
MQMSFWQLGLKNAWRDWRAGQLRLIVVAVALAVAALTAVGFFADRLKGGLERDARQLLGGDVVISSDRPTPPAFIDEARRLGLNVAATVSFPTMARAREEDGGDSRLVAFKAVEAGYPLRGSMRVASEPGQPGTPTREVPAPGQVWVDPGLLDALGLEPGQTLLLGEARLRISRLIIQEPDRGAGFMSFSPRVMINQADVAATGLIQPASRTNYRLAVAGADAPVRDYQRWAQAQIQTQSLRARCAGGVAAKRPAGNEPDAGPGRQSS